MLKIWQKCDIAGGRNPALNLKVESWLQPTPPSKRKKINLGLDVTYSRTRFVFYETEEYLVLVEKEPRGSNRPIVSLIPLFANE